MYDIQYHIIRSKQNVFGANEPGHITLFYPSRNEPFFSIKRVEAVILYLCAAKGIREVIQPFLAMKRGGMRSRRKEGTKGGRERGRGAAAWERNPFAGPPAEDRYMSHDGMSGLLGIIAADQIFIPTVRDFQNSLAGHCSSRGIVVCLGGVNVRARAWIISSLPCTFSWLPHPRVSAQQRYYLCYCCQMGDSFLAILFMIRDLPTESTFCTVLRVFLKKADKG